MRQRLQAAKEYEEKVSGFSLLTHLLTSVRQRLQTAKEHEEKVAVFPQVFAIIVFLLACTRPEGTLTRFEASGRESRQYFRFVA